ncbi:hypothetical protein Taro_011697, partial [Colocasia esculenta]|nr:hypothetical protein [Colocasia esculenta]
MATTSVASVYLHVVDDVISKVREEFINYGVGENILNELQGLWEMKMMQCGVISGNVERPSLPKANGAVTPVHDLNVPYEGPTEEYETPTAEMLFPPTPMQTPIPTPLPGTVDSQIYQAATPNDFASNDDTRDGEMKVGRPSPYMQPPSPWMNQRPLGVDVNVAYDEGQDESDRRVSHQPRTQDFFMSSSGKRKRDDYVSHVPPDGYIPQQDGTADVTIEFLLPETRQLVVDMKQGRQIEHASIRDGRETAKSCVPSVEVIGASHGLPQFDGSDDYDALYNYQGVPAEEYNTPADQVELHASTPSVGTPKVTKTEATDGDEPPLNEDDDDDELDDLDQEEEEPNTQHLVLALFDKVTRAKNRWKCMLKDGIMHLNTRDILFNKV